MRLGVDVDGVVLDTLPLFHKAFEKLGLKIQANKLHSWAFTERYDTSTEIVNKVLSKVATIVNVALIPGAQILNKIVNLPHIESPIHFVSSRHPESYCPTKAALRNYFNFPFFLYCGINKGDACNILELDFFVEDGPPHIKDIYWYSNTHLYILDKPYNREIDYPKSIDVLRVKNWSEILVDLAREGYREAVRVKNGDIDG